MVTCRQQLEPLRRREGELLKQLVERESVIADLQAQLRRSRSVSPASTIRKTGPAQRSPNRSSVSFAVDPIDASRQSTRIRSPLSAPFNPKNSHSQQCNDSFLSQLKSVKADTTQQTDSILSELRSAGTDPSLSLSTDIQLDAFHLPQQSINNDTLHRLDRHIADFMDNDSSEHEETAEHEDDLDATHVQKDLEALIAQAMANDATMAMAAGEAASVLALADKLDHRIDNFASSAHKR